MPLVHLLEYVHLAIFVIGVVATIFGFVAIARGIAPALWRLGNGFANRQIALFAKGDNVSSLRHLLLDSKLIRNKNIIEVTRANLQGRLQHS